MTRWNWLDRKSKKVAFLFVVMGIDSNAPVDRPRTGTRKAELGKPFFSSPLLRATEPGKIVGTIVSLSSEKEQDSAKQVSDPWPS
jgi:hypothetical protein